MEAVQPPASAWDAFKPALISMAKSELSLRDSLELFERAYVQAALEITNGNQVKASKLIQTHRNTIARWSRLR